MVEADIRHLALAPNSFDLVHVRYVLVHLPDFSVALDNLVKCLKPGGWLVLEEPDFSSARAIVGGADACLAVNRVNSAIMQLFADRAMDCGLGIRLPAIVQAMGVQPLSVEADALLAAGGTGIATVMRLSALQLAEQYIATQKTSLADIQHYCRFAEDPTAWAIYYTSVGVIAQMVC